MVKYFIKCINQHGAAHLTLGREYEQKFYKQDSGSVTVTNDDGAEFTYPSCLFGVSHVETAAHKHANPIRAWANGAIIQYRFDNAQDWQVCEDNHPKWLRNYEYRVKPSIDIAKLEELYADKRQVQRDRVKLFNRIQTDKIAIKDSDARLATLRKLIADAEAGT